MSDNVQEAEKRAEATEAVAKQARADSDKEKANEAVEKAQTSQKDAEKAK